MTHRPGIKEKLFFLLSGALISTPFPALANSLIDYFILIDLPSFYGSLISVVIAAPILEEFAKAYPLFYRHGETERSIFTLGFLTGLGFGIAEFFLYTLVFDVPATLRLPLVLFHATNTAIVAFGIGKHRALVYYLLTVILHALYNFSITSGSLNLIAIFSIAFSFILSWFLYKKTREVQIDHGLSV